jgi:two-component system chemotaxis response regulator CheY
MSAKRVLSIGQCGADHGAIAYTLHKHFGAEVESAATTSEALVRLCRKQFDLVLVNRLLDYDGSPGLEAIRQIKADPALSGTPVMLVSNYEDAQEQAAAEGALPGFGKAGLGQPLMLDRVRAALDV